MQMNRSTIYTGMPALERSSGEDALFMMKATTTLFIVATVQTSDARIANVMNWPMITSVLLNVQWTRSPFRSYRILCSPFFTSCRLARCEYCVLSSLVICLFAAFFCLSFFLGISIRSMSSRLPRPMMAIMRWKYWSLPCHHRIEGSHTKWQFALYEAMSY